MNEPVLDNAELQLLKTQLETARAQNQLANSHHTQGTPIKFPGIGTKVSTAYEQLRKDAEYAEEHLLLQRAIRRFLYRSLSFSQRREAGNVAEELIVELTQAGYLGNSAYSSKTTAYINDLINAHYLNTYWQLRDARVGRDTAAEWVLDILSVAIEELLKPHFQKNAIASFAHAHYMRRLPKAAFLKNDSDDANYDTCLYIAIHKALFASDAAEVRYVLLSIHAQNAASLPDFIALNKTISRLYAAPLTQRIERAVGRYGAPLRILSSMADERTEDMPELLQDPAAFMRTYNHYIHAEYQRLKSRINRGVIKSIVFVLITKVLIGLAVEIPYDLLTTGVIALLPLAVNLLFPPLYMASLRLSMHMPTKNAAEALYQYIYDALYQPLSEGTQRLRVKNRPTPAAAKVAYTILFFLPFTVTCYLLMLLKFNIVQGIIFFVFFSTVSFLGFRLAHMGRDLMLASEEHSILASLRDFFYLPFIMVGQWISRKYARVNIVARVLDIVIELPLKTVIRLLRQWTKFLNEKHDELL